MGEEYPTFARQAFVDAYNKLLAERDSAQARMDELVDGVESEAGLRFRFASSGAAVSVIGGDSVE